MGARVELLQDVLEAIRGSRNTRRTNVQQDATEGPQIEPQHTRDGQHLDQPSSHKAPEVNNERVLVVIGFFLGTFAVLILPVQFFATVTWPSFLLVLVAAGTATYAILHLPLSQRRRGDNRQNSHPFIAAAITFALLLAAFIIPEPGHKTRDEPQPTGVTQPGSGSAFLADPYKYLTQAGYPPKRQECKGLLGICLGQPIEMATAAFGPSEADGSPRKDLTNRGWMCHSWDPPRLEMVSVCEKAGEIKSITLWPTSGAPAALALPEGLAVTLPIKLSKLASDVTTALDNRPYTMDKLDGEGYWQNSFSWHFIGLAEGTPDAIIEVSGTEDISSANTYQPKVCNYAAYLKAFGETTVASIEIRDFGDSEVDPCPGTI
jgi:hypothetical protein